MNTISISFQNLSFEENKLSNDCLNILQKQMPNHDEFIKFLELFNRLCIESNYNPNQLKLF